MFLWFEVGSYLGFWVARFYCLKTILFERIKVAEMAASMPNAPESEQWPFYGMPPSLPSSENLGEETLRAMLARENELRLAPETQEIYRQVEADESDAYESWMEVTIALQERVVEEFFPSISMEDDDKQQRNQLRETRLGALSQMRAAALRHPDLALYVRFNRSRRGDIIAGEDITQLCHTVPLNFVMPSCSSHDTAMLHEFVPPHPVPLVICGLSYS